MAARPPHAKQVGPFALAWPGSLPFFPSSHSVPPPSHAYTHRLPPRRRPTTIIRGEEEAGGPKQMDESPLLLRLLLHSWTRDANHIQMEEREKRGGGAKLERDRKRGRGMVYGTAAVLFLGANGVPFCMALKVVRPPCIFSITYKWAPPPPSSISRLPINLNEISGSWLGREG